MHSKKTFSTSEKYDIAKMAIDGKHYSEIANKIGRPLPIVYHALRTDWIRDILHVIEQERKKQKESI